MRGLSKKIILLAIILGIMFMPIGTVKATLQSNPNTHDKKQAEGFDTWVRIIRNMENTGESMGLSEKISSDLTSEGESNNIDMHFMKNTEYGAVAILSASGYGNPEILQESAIKTTTGNETGVYFWGDVWEATFGVTGYDEVDSRYFDTYTISMDSARIGDATGESTTPNPGCYGWHNALSSSDGVYYHATWGTNVAGRNFVRGWHGLFSYSSNANASLPTGGLTCAHGVAVCGAGF